jgi:peptidoglycan/LPS O-acetylase OafA/YrhL
VMAYIEFGQAWKQRFPGWMLPFFLLAMWAVFLYRFDFHKAWFFCLIVGLALPLFRQMTTEWVVVPSGLIARYSYGIYLTHPFAIVIGLYLLRSYSLPVRLVGELIPLVVLPVVAYHALEHPMVRIGSRLAAKAEAKYEQREQQHYRNAAAN